MKKIVLNKTLPKVFENEVRRTSEIWLQDLIFEKGKKYLVEAISGAGKSSFCSYIYGNRLDYLGNILFDDINIKTYKSVQWDKIHCTELSFLFQDLRLFPELTAFENIKLKNNLTNCKSDEQILELLDLMKLGNKKNTLVAQLSWGQQQRIAIIRCLCQPFDFLLLDEPISHLDDENSQLISKIIEDEISETGASVIETSIGKHLPINYTKVYQL